MSDEKEPQKLQNFLWKAIPSSPKIYSNMLHVGWTLDDVRITFGAIKAEDIDRGSYVTEEQGSAVIGWRQAKTLRDVLNRLVDAYEAKNGEIRVPYLASMEGSDEG
jgi:hypothetical protein